MYSLFLWFESQLSGKPNKLTWFIVNSFKNVLIMETKTSFVMLLPHSAKLFRSSTSFSESLILISITLL